MMLGKGISILKGIPQPRCCAWDKPVVLVTGCQIVGNSLARKGDEVLNENLRFRRFVALLFECSSSSPLDDHTCRSNRSSFMEP